MNRRLLPVSAALLATAAAAPAQITTLVLEGDPVPGVGNVTVIRNCAQNDNGDWLAEVRTDFGSNSADVCVLKNGQLFLREGQTLQQPAGATIANFDAMTMDNSGNTAMNLTLGNVPAGTDSGIYWNDKLVIREGDTSTAFGTGTVYKAFLECQINNSNQILVSATVEDPTVAGTNEPAIVILDLDSQGNLIGETKVVIDQDNIGTGAGSGAGQPFIATSSFAHHFGFNDSGSVMYYGRCDTGMGATDDHVMLDQTTIVEESQPSFIPGRAWGATTTPEMDVNNSGDWVMAAVLGGGTADDNIIFKNGQKVIQEGDPVPGLPAFVIQSFLSAPVEIGENGDIVWYALWDDANTAQNNGIFVNSTLTIQAGVTQVGQNTIKSLVGLVDGFHLSHSGTLLMFEAELDNNLSGLFQMTSGSVGEPGTRVCFGDGTAALPCPCGNFGGTEEGCANSTGLGGQLTALGSTSAASSAISFTGTKMPASRIAMLISGPPASGGSGFIGDGLSCVSAISYHGATLTSVSGTANWGSSTLSGANFTPGQTVMFQLIYRDPVGGICGTQYNTSAAYEVLFTQ